MKKQIRAIVAVAAATMILTGCATRQQNNSSEQNNTPKNSTSQAQSSTTSSSSTETTPAGENWSLLDHLPEWAEGTVTPAVTTDPPSGMFITVDDALTFIPLDNVIGIKLPSGIVYP